jgi:hypothetical protein
MVRTMTLRDNARDFAGMERVGINVMTPQAFLAETGDLT